MKHTNKLANETSPYLLQHAHNPVDWYPWGEEAFDLARREDKPVLLSVGYSSCHWCHVMEHESFEDEETAALMNELFVSVKVDREERPDVDGIYMQAVQMMTGSGGWPMTVFLRPDGAPFYGGTYYPPEERHGMPSFRRVLKAVSETYKNARDDVDSNAGKMLHALEHHDVFRPSEGEPDPDALFAEAFRGIARNFDNEWGGFGGAPKFPASMVMDRLLRFHARTGRPDALHMVEHSLEKMYRGGIYDHIGGGFARYSTDKKWLVPHFEKMLYDNALLARLYLDAWKLTSKALYRRVVEETLDWVLKEMTSPEGAFYSTLDADSEGEEGKFYVWSPEEIESLLGADSARLVCAYFDVTKRGNFEGHNILWLPRDAETVAAEQGVTVEVLLEAVEKARPVLYSTRAKRIWPGRDEKTLAAWNGLMMRAFAEAGPALGRQDYVEVARKNAEFVTQNMRRDGLLLRTSKDGEAKLNAYLEDYAYLIEGLVSVYEATFDERWLSEAGSLASTMIDEFWDDQNGGFYFTGRNHEQLIQRRKEFEDNATPSGNSSAAWGLLRLSELTSDDRHRQCGEGVVKLMHEYIGRYGRAFGHMLCAADFALHPPAQIALVGDDPELFEAAHGTYVPARVIAGGDADIPLLKDRGLVDGKPAAYVCRHFACQLPATSPDVLVTQLRESV